MIIIAFLSEFLVFFKVLALKKSINSIENFAVEKGNSVAVYFPLF